MTFVKKLPWLSLALLTFTYSVFGWLFTTGFTKEVWLLAALALLITLVFTALFSSLKNCFAFLFKSDISAFITIIVASFTAVVILCWFYIFVRILVIVSAVTLARIDLQSAGYNEVQAFVILSLFSLAGLGLGLTLNHHDLVIKALVAK